MTPIDLTLEDVYCSSDCTQRVQIRPSSDQVVIALQDAQGQDIGYVCLEVAGTQLVLDYCKPEDFPAQYTERITLRELTEGEEA